MSQLLVTINHRNEYDGKITINTVVIEDIHHWSIDSVITDIKKQYKAVDGYSLVVTKIS